MTRRSPDPELVTMTFRGVNREAAHLLEAIEQASPGWGRTRGELLSAIFYEKACATFGVRHTESILRRYRIAQQQLEALEKK